MVSKNISKEITFWDSSRELLKNLTCNRPWLGGNNLIFIVSRFGIKPYLKLDQFLDQASIGIRWTFTDGITGKSWFELQISLEIDIILSEMTYIKSKYS